MFPIFNNALATGAHAIPGGITRAHVSKHSAKPGEGKVRIGKHSGLQKLMRAARRGLVPQERLFVIETAMRNAHKRNAA